MIQVGDVVSLKSGGPLMTVEYIVVIGSGVTEVLAKWFSDECFRTDRFAANALDVWVRKGDDDRSSVGKS